MPVPRHQLRCMSPHVALFGRDRRVGDCLLLREERKSGLRGPISVFDPSRKSASKRSAPMGRCSSPFQELDLASTIPPSGCWGRK